jgi:hypothetical protein
MDLLLLTSEAAVCESFRLSQIVAKRSEPFTDCELVKRCVLKATEILCPEKQQHFTTINLSANTAPDSVNDLTRDVQNHLKENVFYSLFD